MNGGAFALVSTGTRYSSLNLKNENEIFMTRNDSDGKVYLSRVQVFPTIENITERAIEINSTHQHKMIHDLQKQKVIIVALNTENQHTEISFYDDKNLFPIMGSFVYFENATFMTDIYFSSTHSLVIKDITGDKRLFNTNDYSITFIPGNPFTEIYIKPYWYS